MVHTELVITLAIILFLVLIHMVYLLGARPADLVEFFV
jgi:hypothetical protein